MTLKNFYQVVLRRLYLQQDDLPLCDGVGNRLTSDKDKANACSEAFLSNFRKDPGGSVAVTFQSGFDVNISQPLILAYLGKLKGNSSCGPDGIPNMFLRKAAVGLVSPLTILYSRSILEARIPHMWRVAKVIPIYKGKGDKTDPNSYRPISLTSYVGKVLERLLKTNVFCGLINTLCSMPRNMDFVSADLL